MNPHGIINWKVWRWGFWVRVFGHGIRVINRNQRPPLFSTRQNGELRFGRWGVKFLRPEKQGGWR